MDCFKKYPKYFETRRSIQLSGNGWNWRSLSLGEQIPYTGCCFNPDEKDGDFLLKLKNSYDQKHKDLELLISEIETSLISLRTYKRVEENFPEAFAFLPKKITTSLSININDIRKKIK